MKNPAAAKLRHLLQSYVHQFNRYACSAASIAILVNAVRRGQDSAESFDPVSQQDLLDRIDVLHWRERLSHEGHKGRHGVSLSDLQVVCRKALDVCGVRYKNIDTLHLQKAMPDLDAKKDQARHQLIQMTTSPNDFILAYFTQGELAGDWFGSHVSPVGTFDPKTQTVLILDVDPEVNGPYQVSFDRFFTGLVGRNNIYHHRGGGWVYIRTVDAARPVW